VSLTRQFYFIRHGETDWNRQGLWQGSIDTDLNDTGREQARAAISKIENLGITRIMTSPMKRCLQTCEIINQPLGLPVSEHPDLRERCFGKLNGRKKSEIDRADNYDPAEYQIEPLDAVLGRASAVIETGFADMAEEKILYISHGGIFRVLHNHFCGTDQTSANAVPYHFSEQNQVWQSRQL